MSWQYPRSGSHQQQLRSQSPSYFSIPTSSSPHSSSTSSLQSAADLPALCRHPTLFSQPPSNSVYGYSNSQNAMAAAAPANAASSNSIGGNAPPLPSPNASEQSQYFGAINPQQSQQVQGMQQPQPQQVSGNESGTQLYLKDFNLVAEAAKRAQVAVVTRDLEEVSL